MAEEKDRLATQASRQRLELDKLQQQLQEKHTYALDAMKTEFDKARAEQEKRHSVRQIQIFLLFLQYCEFGALCMRWIYFSTWH